MKRSRLLRRWGKTMAVLDDPRTYGRTRLSFADAADIDSFAQMLDKFERGEISPEEWRRFRLLRGTYGQRQDADAQMLRVKVPQGVIDAALFPIFHAQAIEGKGVRLRGTSELFQHGQPLVHGRSHFPGEQPSQQRRS